MLLLFVFIIDVSRVLLLRCIVLENIFIIIAGGLIGGFLFMLGLNGLNSCYC